MGAPTSPPPPPLPPPGRSAAPPPPPPPPGAPVSVAAKPWYRRWWAIALWVVLGLGFIANLTDRNTDEVPIEPSAEAQSARAADDEPAEVEASEEAFAAPAFRGRSYLDAEDRAKSVGLTLRAVDEAGNAVAIISRGNWEVEGQNPEPGDMVKAGDEVTVEVFRPRDREREEAERQAAEREREEVAERQALEEERLRHEQDESNYASLEAREFALLMKNPDDYSGDFYVLYGEVSQFDAATGNDTFRAHASHTHQDHFFLDGENVVVTGDAELLHEVVKGDVVKMYVVSLGSLSYRTQIGGATTVPHFRINLIEMLN